MAYLEELLPAFRKGAKIRKKDWKKVQYIYFDCNDIFTDTEEVVSFTGEDFLCNSWEIYKENKPDWNYIIKHNCLCWFWDGSKEYKNLGYLIKINEHSELFHYGCIDCNGDYHLYENCHPVERKELNFYEDRKDK